MNLGGCWSLLEINKWSVLVYLGSSAVCARLIIVLNDPMVTRPCIIPLDKVQCLVWPYLFGQWLQLLSRTKDRALSESGTQIIIHYHVVLVINECQSWILFIGELKIMLWRRSLNVFELSMLWIVNGFWGQSHLLVKTNLKILLIDFGHSHYPPLMSRCPIV